MGIQIVEGRDLVVQDQKVYMRTTRGLEQVDTIYRRSTTTSSIRSSSGPTRPSACPGWSRRTARARQPGQRHRHGVADDKVVYKYVPDMIRFYLSEEPILANVPTYLASDPKEREYILSHLKELVVQVGQRIGRLRDAGGPGLDSRPARRIQEAHRGKIRAISSPKPTLSLSRHPSYVDGHFEGRHIDPAALYSLRAKSHHRAGRADPRGVAQGLAGGQLVAGRREQGHLGALRGSVRTKPCYHASPIRFIG